MKLIYTLLTAIFLGMISMSFHTEPVSTSPALTGPVPASPGLPAPGKDKAASQQAFLAVYKVLMSPRCMNCHPSGDAPLQGDDSHPHTQNVQRGAEGKGVYALKCANCHQPQNTPGEHMPPGNPKWGLPPAEKKMVFQGRTPRNLSENTRAKCCKTWTLPPISKLPGLSTPLGRTPAKNRVLWSASKI